MGLAKRLHDLTDDLYLDETTRAELRKLTAEVALLESSTTILHQRHAADTLLIETMRAELDALTAPERDTHTQQLDL